MKNLIIVVLALSTAGLAVFGFMQSRRASELHSDVLSLQAENQKMQEAVAELQASQEKATQQQRELIQLSEQMGAALTREQQQKQAAAGKPVTAVATGAGGSGSAEEGRGGFGKMISSMMQDPEIKKMIREQQRGMMDQLYAPLVQQLGLTPEQGEQLKDIMADTAARSAESASGLFGEGATNRTELMARLTEEQRQMTDQIRALLGDDKFKQYQDYQLTVGERTQLNLFRQQNTGMQNPINDAQSEQLLQMMREEKQAIQAAGAGGLVPGNDAANLEAMMSPDQSEKVLQAQEQINQRVYSRASSVLQPDQLEVFARYQTNQLRTMRMGIEMTRRLMTPEGPK